MNYIIQELEKEVEKLCSTQEKLHNAESEIRTLKSFLTTKTAIVEKRKKELRDTKAKMSELEEKDARRAVILADVLEKTARQYQQQLGALPVSRGGKISPGKRNTVQTPLQTRELRYISYRLDLNIDELQCVVLIGVQVLQPFLQKKSS